MIELININKHYKKKNTITKALENVNLNISENSLNCIIGKSGAGKSTLLNILATIDKQTSGQYKFNEKVISGTVNELSLFRKENIGLIVQNFALINNITVFENIALPLKYSKIPKKDIENKVVKIAEQLHIENKLKEYPTELSGGECQRVAIGRAIIKNPKLLLADEPTGSLDSENRDLVLKILKSLQNSLTIVLATHDSNVYDCADKIIKLDNGQLA